MASLLIRRFLLTGKLNAYKPREFEGRALISASSCEPVRKEHHNLAIRYAQSSW